MGVWGIEFAGEEVAEALSLEEWDKQSASEISIKLILVFRKCCYDGNECCESLYLYAAASFLTRCALWDRYQNVACDLSQLSGDLKFLKKENL